MIHFTTTFFLFYFLVCFVPFSKHIFTISLFLYLFLFIFPFLTLTPLRYILFWLLSRHYTLPCFISLFISSLSPNFSSRFHSFSIFSFSRSLHSHHFANFCSWLLTALVTLFRLPPLILPFTFPVFLSHKLSILTNSILLFFFSVPFHRLDLNLTLPCFCPSLPFHSLPLTIPFLPFP